MNHLLYGTMMKSATESETLLRKQIRDLGGMLGEVIREHAGEKVFILEEEIRTLAKSQRKSPDPAQARRLRALIRRLSPREAYQILSAFTLYFQLVNMAEDLHRNRRRHAYQQQGRPQPGSLQELAVDLKEGALSSSALRAVLKEARLGLTLTAHPTEAKRRTVMHKERAISFHLNKLEYESLTPSERVESLKRIRYHIAGLWNTKTSRSRRINVLDEVHNVLSYFDLTLGEALPWLHRGLEEALGEAPGTLAPFLTLGSWVGGDRDGHPHVTAEVTRKVLLEQRKKILDSYRSAVTELIENVSQSEFLTGGNKTLEASIRKDQASFAAMGEESPHWYEETELFRAKLSYASRKLRRTRDFGPAEVENLAPGTAYRKPAEFLAELRLIRSALSRAGLREELEGRLAILIHQVELFGFHLFPLDIRQDSSVIRAAAAGGEGNEEAAELTKTVETIGWAHRHLGPASVRSFILSHCESARDLLSLLDILRREGIKGGLDLIPLFEDSDSLERAASIFEELVSTPAYRRWIKVRGNRQEIMLGFSDSNKESGSIAGLALTHRAEKDLAEAAVRLKVGLTLFYGRGGSIARGGGRSADAIRARSVRGVGVRITEQGEVVSSKYSDRLIAQRNLEQVAVAYLRSEMEEKAPETPQRWEERLAELAGASREAYRALVYQDPGFLAYFREATPVAEISGLNIGSRPSRRNPEGGLESLRAIPWVFAWSQCRALLPGWFGLGSGLEKVGSTEEGLADLRNMAERWPYFRHCLNNIQMSMAKADLQIAREYASLVTDQALARRITGLLEAEFDKTRLWVLKVSGGKEILDNEPRLQESIKMRNPYVDPLSLIQVELLRRIRRKNLSFENAKSRADRFLLEGLLLSINGVSAGLRNTG